MNWISKLNSPGHISQSINNFNNAVEELKSKRSLVEVSRLIFDAMNNFQTEWAIFNKDKDCNIISNLIYYLLALYIYDHQ